MSADMHDRNSRRVPSALARCRSGFTLLELLLALAIISIMSVAVCSLVVAAMTTNEYLIAANGTNSQVELAVARMLHNLRMCSTLSCASTQYNFDNISLADETWTVNTIPNWTATGFSGHINGVFNPQNAQITNSTGSSLPGTATGTNYAYLSGTGYIVPSLAPVTVAAAGNAYTLKVAASLAKRYDRAGRQHFHHRRWHCGCHRGGKQSDPGRVTDTTVTYTTVAGDVGQPLSVELSCSSSSGQIGYNNVRLSKNGATNAFTIVTQADPNNSNATYTVTYALSGTNLTETDTRYGTNTICGNVSTFSVQLLSTDVVQVSLIAGTAPQVTGPSKFIAATSDRRHLIPHIVHCAKIPFF